MVSMVLGLLLVAMAVGSIQATRNLYETDITRIEIAHRLRAGMNLMGVQIRQAGELLSNSFPAIELENGANGDPDLLIIRKNLLDHAPGLCVDGASGDNFVQISLPGKAGCSFNDTEAAYNAWRDFRIQAGGEVSAYIWDFVGDTGEQFTYSSEDDISSTGTRTINASSAGWSRDYPANSSHLYFVEEWRFSLVDSNLQVQINDDPPNSIISGVDDLQVELVMNDGTVVNELGPMDDWTELSFIRVILEGTAELSQKSVSRSITNTFFPRNLISKD